MIILCRKLEQQLWWTMEWSGNGEKKTINPHYSRNIFLFNKAEYIAAERGYFQCYRVCVLSSTMM